MRKLMILASVFAFCGTAQAADVVRHKRVVVQQEPQVVYVRDRGPLGQIPIVGTVVYGGLDYAGALILSPLEIFRGPPPQEPYRR